MILEEMNEDTFSVSYDSESKEFTLMKKTGRTWHRTILSQEDMSAVIDVLKKIKDSGVIE